MQSSNKKYILFFNTFFIISIFLLNSCSTIIDNATETTQYVAPTKIEPNFSISGKLNAKNSTNSLYCNYSWLKDIHNNEYISLKNPLGITLASMSIISGNNTLHLADGRNYTGIEIDKIIEQNIGVAIPLNYMHYWVQGIPLPQYQYKLNKDGFTQLSYTVQYLAWYDKNHPKLINISQDNLLIKIFIKWN